MTSLLDLFAPEDPAQKQGLLAATMALLQSGAPSRRPISTMEGLIGAQQAYGQSMDDYKTRDIARQTAAQNLRLGNLKMQDAESDLKNQELARADAERLRQFYLNRGAGGMSPMPAPQSAASMMGGMVNPAQAPAQAPASPTMGGSNTGIYQQRLAEAQDLRNAGFHAQADAAEAAALKFMPKVKGWEKVQQGGRVMLAPFFEDGTSGAPVPLDVAEKLDKVNTGGKTELVNPYTGSTVRAMANTVDPNTVYSGNITMRGQNMTDARAREQLNQGKIPAGYRATKDGNLEAIPGGPAADKVTSPMQKLADAKDVITLLDQAEPLVKKATGSYGGMALDAGARLFGKSTDGAEAAAQLSALEGMLVSKMPKMSGPQSDKDVAMYKQMAGRIGDPTLPADSKLAAMKTIREINQRYIDTTPTAPAKPAGEQKFNMLPPAAQYDGKRMKADNGTIYKSVGGKWVKE